MHTRHAGMPWTCKGHGPTPFRTQAAKGEHGLLRSIHMSPGRTWHTHTCGGDRLNRRSAPCRNMYTYAYTPRRARRVAAAAVATQHPADAARAAASAASTSAEAVAPRWGSNCPGPLRTASLHCSAPVAAAASPGRRTCGSSEHLCLHDDIAAAAETCQCRAHTLAPTTDTHATTGESQDTCTITALRRRSRQPPTS